MRKLQELRAVLVDDEDPSRDEIKYLLEEVPGINVCGEADSGESALEVIAETGPDVVFLDIQMYDMDGLAVADELLKKDNPPLIIFATAYKEHAVKAFEINAVDYILKPFSQKRVVQAVNRVQNILKGQDKDIVLNRIADLIKASETSPAKSKDYFKFPVEKNGRIYPLELNDICFFYVENKDIKLVTGREEFTVNCTLQHLEQKLPESHFFRTHRAYLVNLNRIEQIIPWFNCTYKLIMKDYNKTEVLVSRTYSKKFKEIFSL